MNREQLSKYKKNKRDIENLDGIIAKLQERLDAVPVVSGKVTKRSDAFPYIEAENEEVEKYIAAMSDGTAKDIFEMVFLDGMTQKDAGECLNCTQGRIAQIIKENLQD